MSMRVRAAFAAAKVAPAGPVALGYREPLRVRPPRAGLRPGTAAGDPQMLW
jgi:hypothetical protein